MTAVLLLIGVFLGQTFDAASVKRSAPGNPSGSTFDLLSGGGLKIENGTLKGLIESAYDIRDFQVFGGPGWLATDRFDVVARSAPGDAGASRADDMKLTRLKLQALLADRFRLAVHREARELQEYTLAIEKGGAKLVAETAPPPPTARTGLQTTCGHMTGTYTTVSNLVVVLSRQLKRPVVDRTGLQDRYNFQLDWTPDLAPCSESNDNNAPSIFTALREQLGLKLESIKGPVETIVVDRAEKPSED